MGLYPYQQTGAGWLSSGGLANAAYLADGMGLGKTVQAAHAAAWLAPQDVLVVAPASALENWRREWMKWGPLNPHHVLFVSYASKELRELAERQAEFDVVILDEAHYCKNPQAQRTLAALDIARRAGRAMLLSGTPMPNHPGELWAPIRAMWPEIPEELGIRTYREWIDRFCQYRMVRWSKWGRAQPKFFGAKNMDELRPYLQQIILRRTLEDVGLDLPPLRIDLSLLPRDAGFARELECLGINAGNLEERMEAEEGDNGSLSRLRRLLGEYKAPRIAAQLRQELEDGEYEKIVVLAHHRSVLGIFRDQLDSFGVAGFDGGTPASQRQRQIDEFSGGNARVFVAQQNAAGIAINLQSASEIVLVEPAWSPDDNRQAIKRVHRIGTERPVRARVFGLAGSLDEGIMEAIVRKTQMQEEAGLR